MYIYISLAHVLDSMMYTCIRTRRPHKVIVSARSTLSCDVCLRHKAWDDRLLYKVYERRPRSQCVV